MSELDYGVQLYSLHDFTEADLGYALSRLPEFGYKSVEFAGFFGNTAAEIKEMLQKNGLRVCGSHLGLDKLRPDNIGETLDFHAEIGCENIVIAAADVWNAAQLADVITQINRIIPEVRARGMELHYHTHDHNYLPNNDGLIPIAEIEAKTDVFIEIDTYWAFVAGRDPVEEMKRLKGRVKMIHLRDVAADRSPRVLGEGVAPVAACDEAAKELGYYPVIESEGMIPDGITDVKHCIKYIKKLISGEIPRK